MARWVAAQMPYPPRLPSALQRESAQGAARRPQETTPRRSSVTSSENSAAACLEPRLQTALPILRSTPGPLRARSRSLAQGTFPAPESRNGDPDKEAESAEPRDASKLHRKPAAPPASISCSSRALASPHIRCADARAPRAKDTTPER